MAHHDSFAGTVSLLGQSSQEENYPKSLCKRSLFYRPLPQGKRVYFILLQLILLNVVEGITEKYFQLILIKYYEESGASSILTSVSFRSIPLLLCLPMGFIADRYFGRAKVLYYSWVSLFIAQLVIGFYLVFAAAVLYDDAVYIIGIVIVSIALLINSFSLAGIRVNVIPFGVDQMEMASSDQLSSYFHWYYWCRNLGQFFTFSVGGSLVLSKHDITSLLVSSSAAAVGVLVNIFGYKWFINREKVGNPLLLIYRVIRYAATTRRPANRSSFSYDDRPEPSRIDLAKETHFGLFSDEKVEDVKTFLRILVFLTSLLGFLCIYTIINVYVQQSGYFHYPAILSNNSALYCTNSSRNFTVHNFTGIFSLDWIFLINNTTVLLMIPILDRIVYSLCYPWMPSMLKRMGVGVIASLVSIICAITVEAVRVYRFESGSPLGINVLQYQSIFSVDISVGVMAPQLFIQGTAECLTLITVVEFIYAQSPVYMKGLLLGCLFFTEGIALTLGSLLFLSQSNGRTVYWEYFRTIKKNVDYCKAPVEAGSCISAYVVIAIVTFLGIVLFFYSARNYKSRIRGQSQQYFTQL